MNRFMAVLLDMALLDAACPGKLLEIKTRKKTRGLLSINFCMSPF